MKAITPFIASLPEDEQNRIEAEVAGRIFAARDFSKVGHDPYPLNTHELLVKLIDKLDLKPKDQKPKKMPEPETLE